MAANEFPLTVKGLTKIYPSFRLDGVSFDLRPGAVTGFIGRNGAGKTTTLNSLLGFVRPDGGEALFWGMDMEKQADAIKKRIGFVSAGMTYYTRKKIRTITEVTKSFYPGWSDETYRRYMQRFGLEESKTPAALSNGMKIKYALALALSHGAELLILDEPTSGLDPVSREELTEIFLSLRDEGKTILFSTHITADLEKCADRILYIRAGRLAADSAMDDFAGAYRIMLDLIKKHYPNAEVWCISPAVSTLRGDPAYEFPYRLGGIHLREYADAIGKVAAEKGCVFVDANKNTRLVDAMDGIHPDKNGMMTLADEILKARGICC